MCATARSRYGQPVAGSGAFPLLQRGAIEIADKLALHPDPDAHALRVDLLNIVAKLQSWEREPPAEQDRRETIDLLVELLKRGHSLWGRPST